MEAARVLFVDDDNNSLQGYKRLLYGLFEVETALGGVPGLAAVHLLGPFDVIIADMQMPGMSGAEFLAQVRQLAPNSVRMILTGHKDLNRAIKAVNEGRIFRYLTKPCGKDDLVHAIELGVAEYRTNIAEDRLVKEAKEIKSQVVSLSKSLFSQDPR